MDPFQTSNLGPCILNTPCYIINYNSWKRQNVFKFVYFTEQLSQITQAKKNKKVIEKLPKAKAKYFSAHNLS